MTSTAHTHGWLLAPHLEIATPFSMNTHSFAEPFVALDWVNDWQSGYTERGASGFNLVMHSHYSSILRSEAGFRFYEEWNHRRGKFLFTQKASYINLAPFQSNPVTTAFVSSASNFSIAIGSTKTQNLGGVELRSSFIPWNEKYPYFTTSFQGEFGPHYQSYFLNLEIGRVF